MKLFQKKSTAEEIDFDQERQEKLTEFGLCFQKFRQDKNLSIEVISNQIHIPMRLIKAIETGSIQELPEPVYTRELIRKYANYLGLKGDDFASQFNIEVQKNRRQNQKFNFYFPFSQLRLNPVYLYVIYIVLMLVTVKSLADFLKISPLVTNSLPNIETNTLEKPSNNSPEKETAPEVIPVVDNQEKTPPKPTQVTVNVKVEDECWVRVTIDGKPELEKVLKKGEKYEWTAKKQLTIRAGNAGGLVVSFNEEKEKTLGELGQVEEVTFELPSNS
jgi:cytoskeletal protein RodZ